MSDMKPRQAVHRSANVRRDAWDRRSRPDVSTKSSLSADADMRTEGRRVEGLQVEGKGPEGESRVVRRTAAWDLPDHSLPSELFGMRLKSEIRGTSSPTLPGFPVVLHERGGNGANAEILYRFKDADGRERMVSERREPPAGPSIISYAALLTVGQDGDWEMGYLATIALCRMLVKERFTGRLDMDSVGLDPSGKVVWVKPGESKENAVSVSYVAELNPGQLVSDVGSMFYHFVTARQADELQVLTPPSEVNVQAPIWVDTIYNAAFGEHHCANIAEFLDVLHQHLTDEQREQMTSRLAEWALRTRRLSQPTEDAVAVQLGMALSQLGAAATQRARRRRRAWVPVGVATVATLLGVAVVLLRHLKMF